MKKKMKKKSSKNQNNDIKVLLVGEYSGFHINLKKGLKALGVDCYLAANGDVWKKIDGADFSLFKDSSNSMFGKIWQRIIMPLFCKKPLYGYDYVQLIDPKIYNSYINKIMIKRIIKHNKKVFVSVPGACFSLYNAYKKGLLGYYIFDDNPKLSIQYECKSHISKLKYKQEKYIYSHVDAIIPIMYEYAVGVRHLKNCKRTIPLPFDCTSIECVPNKASDKIVIMHGIIREKDKGTDIIRKALEIIQKRYGDMVEIVYDGKMPLSDYLEKLKTINVLVDQCKEHCYGMNALYAMAEGRIVLGGASDNSLKEFGLNSCPVIHIEPNVEQIVEQLEYVISQKDNFEIMGKKARDFVEQFHDCKKIAQEYLDVWSETI